MSARFEFRRAGGSASEPWFRLGSLEVSTVILVVLVTVATWIVFAISPSLAGWLTLDTDKVFGGQVWRIATWPFSAIVGFSSALNLLFLWLFGRDLEEQLGRVRMAKLLVWLGVIVVVTDLFLGAALRTEVIESGMWRVGFYVLGIWVLEYPYRRMLFNIPSWFFGVAIVFIQVLSMLTYRSYVPLLAFLLGLGLAAVLARTLGLASDFPQIPSLARRGPRRPRRSGRLPRVPRKLRMDIPDAPPQETVVEGPWVSRRNRDQERLDALLDKIHAGGMESLSETERVELVELSERLRGR